MENLRNCFKTTNLATNLLIVIHQLEGILLIRIIRYNICNSYEAKSKTFIVGNDFCWIEAPAKRKN